MEVIAFGFVLDETSYLRDVGLPGGCCLFLQGQGWVPSNQKKRWGCLEFLPSAWDSWGLIPKKTRTAGPLLLAVRCGRRSLLGGWRLQVNHQVQYTGSFRSARGCMRLIMMKNPRAFPSAQTNVSNYSYLWPGSLVSDMLWGMELVGLHRGCHWYSSNDERPMPSSWCCSLLLFAAGKSAIG
jgi:hypothetical protein